MGRLKSDRMENFCLNYAQTCNATQSYKDAGYTVKNDLTARSAASQLLTNPNIQQRLAELRAEADEQRKHKIASIAEIQEILSQMVRGEMDEEVIVTESEGDGFSHARKVKKKITPADRIRAADKLLRSTGGYLDKVEVTGTAVVQFAGEDELAD